MSRFTPVLLALLLALPAGAADLGAPADVAFKAQADGSTQRYVEMLPRPFDAEKPCDLLIALHGHGSDRWQYVKADRGECKAARDVAARRGMIFVAPDYRASTSWMGPSAEADLVQLIGELRAKYRVGKVYFVGASMGGTAVLIFAALHPELVDGVCSQNGTANMLEFQGFAAAVAASYGGDREKQRAEYQKRSPELVPEQFTMPVAFTVGGKDTVVPPDSVRRLAERLQKLKKQPVLLIDRPTGGHATSYEDTAQALDFVLRAGKP